MTITASVTRLATNLIALLQTRVELVATEVEEEALRYFSCLLMSLAALFCAGAALLFGAFLAVVLYWESHRIGVLLSLTVLFLLAATIIGLAARSRYRHRPRLLTHTMAELAGDAELLQPPA